MIEIISENIITVDVDDTLVSWEPIPSVNPIEFNNYGCIENLYPIQRHIDLIKKNFERKMYIIVWSQNGHQWCKEVINKLGLEQYINMIMTKPSLYVDDLDANAWMKRIYLK